MKQIDNFENIQASTDASKLLPGGYVVAIMNVEDFPDKEYLKIEFDIAEGEFMNYYSDMLTMRGFWGGKFIRSYKEKAQGMFKAFISAVEKSNDGFKWNWDESKLAGQFVGVVLGEEEYIGNTGDVKTRLYVKSVKTVDDIREGKYKVPDKKCLPDEPTGLAGFTSVTEELPF